MNKQGMLTLDEVEREFALKRSTLYCYVRRGMVTPYKRVGDRRSYFKRFEIENLIQFHPRETAVNKLKHFSPKKGNGVIKKEANQ